MSLIGSGADAPVDCPDPAMIDWSRVKSLWIMDMADDHARHWQFWPCVEFSDQTWIPMEKKGDITSARQCCARLAAIYDRPVRDWTLPIPPALATTVVGNEIRQILSMGEDVEKAPIWGSGWELADFPFLNGMSDDAFAAELDEHDRIARETFADAPVAADGVTLKQAIQIVRGEGVRRWRLLHAANRKPPAMKGGGA
ncbi:hypothetical protein J2D73_19285 [Acetobacter sacchari]|uniref:Uncharacterized protein n=1 Tax=Acetobacter sacchari TaxID=2661687 RepID=A0ABS3M1B6_9PROT|nr:hypothetical protein [Acetobacter sacchari]MBO1361930.1 hypothetical protein [Acetobacter sacchari]